MLLVLIKRFLGLRRSHDSGTVGSPEEQVRRVQEGDNGLRNQLITDYQPYVAKVTGRFCKRYIDPARDDEYSVALDAFNEAIDSYSAESGRSFLGFAETVIRRRLIDYIRKEQRFGQQIPYSSFDIEDEEDQVVNPVEIRESLDRYEQDRIVEERRWEIALYSEELSAYGLTFSELADHAPKHADSRRALIGIARQMAADEALMAQFRSTGLLPIKALLERVNVSRKTLERNRKYIIAVALIFAGTYPYLLDYLEQDRPEDERSGSDA